MKKSLTDFDATATQRVQREILEERKRQHEKWGSQSATSDVVWMAILTEEVGESAQAALHNLYGGKAAGTLREELVQVAAVATAWVESIDLRGENRD